MSDRVNLVAPVSPIECLAYLPNARVIHYKLHGTGKVDLARKFKCTTAARELRRFKS